MSKNYIKFIVQCLDENGNQVTAVGSRNISYSGKLTPIELEVYEAKKAGEFVLTKIIELERPK